MRRDYKTVDCFFQSHRHSLQDNGTEATIVACTLGEGMRPRKVGTYGLPGFESQDCDEWDVGGWKGDFRERHRRRG